MGGKLGKTLLLGALSLLLSATAQAALTFNFTPAVGTPVDVINGFQAAGMRWSSLFADDVTVNINIAFPSLGPGILGSTSSTRGTLGYADFRAALAADRITADDFNSVAHLPAGSAFNMLLNYTANNPNGAGSATPYLDSDGDANNSTIRMTLANARALGLWYASDSTVDASISFSSAFSWDFDPSDGIAAGTYDFIGVATHEIGHAMGFVSGVDTLDVNSPYGTTFYNDNLFTYVSPLDMFRFSADSIAFGNGVIDWTAGLPAVDRYFSVDGGTTKIASFALGRTHGDGDQASHWKDDLGLGIMDPTASSGELLAITSNDFRGLDVIGWNPVPEPSTVLLLAGAALFAVRRLRRA